MHILLISGEYPPMQGGVGDYTREMAREFTDQGHQASVLTHASLDDAHPTHKASPWRVYPTVRNWRWGCWSQIADLVRDTRPDVINVQYQAAIYDMRVPAINLLPWRWRWHSEAPPIVVTYHDLKPPYLFPKAGPLRDRAVRVLARYSDAVIVTNAEDLDTAQQWPLFALPPSGVPSSGRVGGRTIPGAQGAQHTLLHRPTLHQIPIGSNIAVSPPADYDRAAWRAQFGYRSEDVVWAYFGFLNESKGGETLIRALALSEPPARLLMIGGRVGSSDPTNQRYAEHVEALMQTLGVADRVRWTGYVPAEQVSAALLSADTVVLPYRDGISFRRGSLHAALAHGCPIVSTTPQVPLPELHKDQNILLVPPEDPEAVSRAAQRLVCDPELRQRIGQGAQALAQQFTWKHIVERTVNDVLNPLIADRLVTTR
jgi:glycosyltransferase involved in cell wall biosynthesis